MRLRLSAVLAILASCLLAACGGGSSAPDPGEARRGSPAQGSAESREWRRGDRLFAADSVWNRPLAANTPLDPTSPQRTKALGQRIRGEIEQGIGPWINEREYSTPFYVVGREQRRVRVRLRTGEWGRPLQRALDRGVPIPADAAPASGTDAHMTIYQPSTDTLWEFWRARKVGGAWEAEWGGAMRRVSQSGGYYSPAAWPGLARDEGWNWGSTATSLPVMAGTITVEELRRGRIDHALAISLADACDGVVAFPAQRTDGTSRDETCIPQGARLRLDPSVDLASLDLPRPTRVIARAAQRYGMIVSDRTHRATSFYAEDPQPLGRDPYRGARGLYDGLEPWDFLRQQFPWELLQLTEMRTCRQWPCRPPTARR